MEMVEKSSWQALGLGFEVARSLTKAGFKEPSRTQAISIPDIVAGKDVVVAAETGSGKTIAYLAPIFNRFETLLAAKEKATLAGKDENAEEVLDKSGLVSASSRKAGNALILCPNIQLCKQVASVAKLMARHVNAQAKVRVFDMTEEDYYNSHGDSSPAIIVCTPTLFEKIFVYYKSGAPRVDLDVKVLVLDETDMLLTGGFEPVTMSILDWCQYEDKQLKIDQVLEHADITYEQFERIPYFFKKAAYQGGVEAMLKAGWKRHKVDREKITAFEKCQYLFTGATIPDYGLRSVQKQIERICPSASWVRGSGLHNPSTFKDRLSQEWLEVHSMEEAYQTLSEQVGKLSGRIIAFNKDVKHAMDCAQVLRGNGDLTVLEFHRKVPLEERIQNLEAFKQVENNAILVCTDAASRGLDIPDVRCVFQIGFASSAVDYLHRIGRTARAGKQGQVVNMYTEDSKDLVTSVMQAIDEERSIQDAFSRKRSFRKKIKKEVKKNRGMNE